MNNEMATTTLNQLTNNNNEAGLVEVKTLTPDEENGCEECWAAARAIADVDSGVVTAEEYRRLKAAVGRCTHDDTEYATSIFVEFQS